jgi:glycosyltransferase involved in cell wall biosynthesis
MVDPGDPHRSGAWASHASGEAEVPARAAEDPRPGRRQRILLLIKGLGRGGAETLLVGTARHFDPVRFEYHAAYLLPWKDALVEDLEACGVQVHCLQGGRGTRWVGRLLRLIRALRVRVIHAHSPVPAIPVRLLVRGPDRPAIVYTEHNVWESYHPLTRLGNAATFARNDHVFAVSERVLRSFQPPRPWSFRRAPPAEVLYHGIDPAAVRIWGSGEGVRGELGIPPEAPVVGTVGNLRADKGHRFLLEAAPRIREVVPDVRFVFVGHGGMVDELRRRSRQLGLDRTVIFAGYRPDAARLAGAFDLFCLPSIHEGLPVSLLEALALGKPAVVTDAGGMPEVVEHGVEGLVVPPRDPHALEEALISLLRAPEDRRRMGEAASRRASRFDIRLAARRCEEVYEELIG